MGNLRMEVEVKNPTILGLTLNDLQKRFGITVVSTTRREGEFIEKNNPPLELRLTRKIIKGDRVEFMGQNENVLKAYRECLGIN